LMIICCGEALIDMLPRIIGDQITCSNEILPDGEKLFLPIPGGALFNTAITLGRLGTKTSFISGISTDQFGDLIIQALDRSNVEHSYAIRSHHPTTLAVVSLNDGHATYSFYDESSAGRMVEVEDLPEIKEPIDAMHFGAISLIPEPCGSSYEALMERHADETVISFDPNIRPTFIKDTEGHRQRMARMVKMSDIIKVSDEDVAWMHPNADLKTVINSWIAQGAKMVCITMGKDGVMAYFGSEEVHMPAKLVEVVDTVGAGDSFNGGLLYSLKQQGILSKQSLANITAEQVKQALDMATSVASITVSRAGANPPWAHEMES